MGKGTKMSFRPASDLLTILEDKPNGRRDSGRDLSGGRDIEEEDDTVYHSKPLCALFHSLFTQSFWVGAVIFIIPAFQRRWD